MCHNPIFTLGIFSGVGKQNETAWTKPAWSDEGSPHQITPRRRSGTHFPKFDQIWLGLTRFDQDWPSLTKGWPSHFWPGWGPLCPKTLETRPRIHFPEFREVWPSLTRVDQGLTKPFLTRLGPTMPKNPRNVAQDTFLRVRRILTKFDQVWLRLTKFDRTVDWTEGWIELTTPWPMHGARWELRFNTLRVENGRETRELWAKPRKNGPTLS